MVSEVEWQVAAGETPGDESPEAIAEKGKASVEHPFTDMLCPLPGTGEEHGEAGTNWAMTAEGQLLADVGAMADEVQSPQRPCWVTRENGLGSRVISSKLPR